MATMSFAADPEILLRVQELCAQEQRSMSNMVRILVKEALDARDHAANQSTQAV